MTMNPISLAANTARQGGETLNQTVQSLQNSVAQTSSTVLQGLAAGVPSLPLPGIAAAPGGGLPVPTQALQALSQLENAVLPAGVPGPAGALLRAVAPGQPPAGGNGNGNGQMGGPTPENRIVRDVPATRTGVTERSGY